MGWRDWKARREMAAQPVAHRTEVWRVPDDTHGWVRYGVSDLDGTFDPPLVLDPGDYQVRHGSTYWPCEVTEQVVVSTVRVRAAG